MKKFYVTPVSPLAVFDKYLADKNLVISYLRPDNYRRAVKNNQIIYFDNGAFTFFRKKITPNYAKFYKFLEGKTFQYFFIPDIIDGTEEQNDKLIQEVPEHLKNKAIPVFHLHESLERLKILIKEWAYIALGSSGKYWKFGTKEWFARMDKIMQIVCDKDGKPLVKIHMLRCLNKDIFTKYPFYNGDSSNFARNHKRDTPEVILNNIEPYNSPRFYDFSNYQLSIYDYLEIN